MASWSSWLDDDLSNSATYYHFRDDLICPSGPVAVQARPVGSENQLTSDIVEFGLDVNFQTYSGGIICDDSLQAGGSCQNYEARFCCASKWSDWTEWSTQCDSDGNFSRSRICTNVNNEDDGKCLGAAAETVPCDLSWTSWTTTACSKTCGGGEKFKTRHCQEANGMATVGCFGDNEMRQVCNTHICGDVAGQGPTCSCDPVPRLAYNNSATCQSQNCDGTTKCQIADDLGNFKCLPKTMGFCRAHGDPHVNTFDGVRNDIYGDARYILLATQEGFYPTEGFNPTERFFRIEIEVYNRNLIKTPFLGPNQLLDRRNYFLTYELHIIFVIFKLESIGF